MKLVRLLSALLLGSTLHSAEAITITEDFSAALPNGPFARGWKAVGDTNLFVWDSAEGNLKVKWDSAKPNSFFHQPLGITVTKTNDFSLAFDFKLLSMSQYVDKPFSFQLAAGFIRLSEATNAGDLRGSGFQSPNLAEFTYFADTGFGASVTPLLICTNHEYALGPYYLFEFINNEQYRVEMSYTSSSQTLSTVIKHNGTNAFTDSFSILARQTNFTDIALDTFAISSYNDDNAYGSSIIADAIIDNIVVTTPAPAIGRVTLARIGGATEASVFCQPGDTYSLERSTNFQQWTNVISSNAVSSRLILVDTTSSETAAFYRIKKQD